MGDDIGWFNAVLKGMGYATGQFGKNHLGDQLERKMSQQ